MLLFFLFWLHWVFAATNRGFSLTVMRDLSCPTASGILVPQPGIKPESHVLEGRFLTAGGEWLKSQVLETSLVAAQEEGADGKKVGRQPRPLPHLSERTRLAPGFPLQNLPETQCHRP